MASLEVIFRPGAQADIDKELALYADEGGGSAVPRFLHSVQEAVGADKVVSPSRSTIFR